LQKKNLSGIVFIALFVAAFTFRVDVVYATQFYLDLETDPLQVQTVDPYALSGEGWHDSGSNVTMSAKPTVIDMASMVKYDFTNWEGADWVEPSGNPAYKFMDGNYTVTANYRISYYLTLVTDPPEVQIVDPIALTGEGWQRSGSYALIDAKQTVLNGSVRYSFVEWIGEDFPGSSGNQAEKFMDGSYTVTAVYQKGKRATPATWIVDDDGPADFYRIQEAVDAALPYDTILVRSGNYVENVSVNKNHLEILGQNRNTTVVTGGFYLNTWYTIIANFTLTAPGGSDMYGFVLDRSSFNVIRKNLVTGFTGGMYFNYMNNTGWPPVLEPSSCHSNIVTDNVIINCKWNDVFFMVGFTDNSFYHNDFYKPTLSTNIIDYASSYNEFWDAGYPCGGNYWAGYNGTDTHNGPYQNLTGSDGIGDTPYTIPSEFPTVIDVDHYPLMNPWTGTVDDLAVLNIDFNKTAVGVGQAMQINVLVANTGDYTESVRPRCYANGTSVTHFLMLPIPLNSSYATVITFTWNTTDFPIGIYLLSANVTAATNETHTSDNTFIQGWVTVTIQGDLNGDFIVDIYDAIKLAGAFNSRPGTPSWNANADINNDSTVDIYDAILLAGHYGQHYP